MSQAISWYGKMGSGVMDTQFNDKKLLEQNQTSDDATKEIAIEYLRDTYKEFTNNPCKHLLRMLIITMFETSQIVCTNMLDEKQGKANYSYVKMVLPNDCSRNYWSVLRNRLVHNPVKLISMNQYVFLSLQKFGRASFEILERLCLGKVEGLYDSIIGYCASEELLGDDREEDEFSAIIDKLEIII